MSGQTDRQTDKATWWSVTAFDLGEQGLLQASDNLPDWVAKVYGGLETCPETERIHFQGAVQCHRQVRFSQVKRWLPMAHWETAKSPEALKKYAMKEETSLGSKNVIENKDGYLKFHEILLKVYANRPDLEMEEQESVDDWLTRVYWHAANTTIIQSPFLMATLLDSRALKGWLRLQPALRGLSNSITREAKNEVLSIEDVPAQNLQTDSQSVSSSSS